MSQPFRISIAMCTYNGGRYLPEQLESLAAQSTPPDELVICDDGSTDETPALISAFSRDVPFDVRMVRNETRLGSTRNFEKAIGLCTGDLIALCDQDDVWLPGKLEKMTDRFAAASTIGGIFSDAILIDESSTPTGGLLWQRFGFGQKEQAQVRREGPIGLLCKREFVTGATLMFRAELRDQFQPIPRSWIHDGWIAWVIALESRLDFITEPLIRYRVHTNQQAGVPKNRSLMDRIRNFRVSESELCARKADRFADLLGYCHAKSRGCSPLTQRRLEEIVHLCRSRATLGSSLYQRARFVSANVPAYLRYTDGGAKTAIRDIVQHEVKDDTR